MPKKNYGELIKKSREREQKKCKKLQEALDKETTRTLEKMRQIYDEEEEYRIKIFNKSRRKK